MNAVDEALLGLLKWIAATAAAAGGAWMALNHRIAVLEKHKADAATVAVMANDLRHIRHTLERLEHYIDRRQQED